MTGSNEIALCFLFAFLLMNTWIYYRVTRKINFFLVTLLIIQLCCVLFLILPAGSGKRAHEFGTTFSLSTGLVAAFLYTTRTFVYLLAEPLAWLIMGIAFISGNRLPGKIKEQLGRAGVRGIYFFLCALLVTFFFYLLIYILSGELLPPRANSLVGFFVLFFLLLAAFCTGSRQDLIRLDWLEPVRKIAMIALIVVFITNPLVTGLFQNLITGYYYHKVMVERERVIENNKKAGSGYAVLASYEIDINRLLTGNKLTKRFNGQFSRYPRLIHYMDPLSDTSLYIHYYAEYRNIDSIEYNGKFYKRIGLIPE